MRTTIDVDDALLLRAAQVSGVTERGELISEALRALIARDEPGYVEPDPVEANKAAKQLWEQVRDGPVHYYPVRPEVAARATPVVPPEEH